MLLARFQFMSGQIGIVFRGQVQRSLGVVLLNRDCRAVSTEAIMDQRISLDAPIKLQIQILVAF